MDHGLAMTWIVSTLAAGGAMLWVRHVLHSAIPDRKLEAVRAHAVMDDLRRRREAELHDRLS